MSAVDGVDRWLRFLADGRSSVLFATLAGFSLMLIAGRREPKTGLAGRRAKVRIAIRAVILVSRGSAMAMAYGDVVILAFYAVYLLLTRGRPRVSRSSALGNLIGRQIPPRGVAPLTATAVALAESCGRRWLSGTVVRKRSRAGRSAKDRPGTEHAVLITRPPCGGWGRVDRPVGPLRPGRRQGHNLRGSVRASRAV